MEGTAFTATHVVSAQGASFWTEPDPNRAAEGRLDPHLPVQVLAETTGWAQVRCSNGWETWIDSRYLSAPGAPAPYATPAPGPAYAARTGPDGLAVGLPLAGAALAILGGFLPWISAPIDSLTAWDIPVTSLFDTASTGDGLKVGPLLLVLVVTLVPLFTRQALPRAVTGALAGVALLLGLLGVRLYTDISDLAPDIGFGMGLAVTIVGALVMGIGATRPS